ncbi:MAG: M28 family peptidase [Bacteroidetes bacterium]|nr:M28 family peptidase [Fibrella sp.]
MRKHLYLLTTLLSPLAFGQTSITVTNATADAIMAGNYTPATYSTGINATPAAISADLNQSISPDSLRDYIRKLASFTNRNTTSIFNPSTTFGLGAANAWVENKFKQLSAQRNNRLIVSRMNFQAAICSSTNRAFSEVFAVLPGTDLTNKSIIVVEGHLDSRCESGCDATCNAPGVSDNATGSVLVLEAARVLSKYNLKATIVFLLTVGEEQGLFGSKAFANYSASKSRAIRMVMNNDLAGTTLCGPCSSSPVCTPGNVATNSVRIFSFGSVNSIHKQLARYTKLEYNEQIKPLAAVPMTINIMSAEDRTGRSGDHVPFRSRGYAAVRTVCQNENGDGSGSCGIVHSVRDTEQIDSNNDGVPDDFSVDFDYLARNTIINANAIAMAAQSVKAPTSFTARYVATNKISLTITDAGNAPAYRVALRSLTNDWDSVYTVSTKNPTIAFAANSSTARYVSVAAVNADGAESLFSGEITVSVPATGGARQTAGINYPDDPMQASVPAELGISVLPSYPNPFDESTYMVLKSDGDKSHDTAYLTIRKSDGTLVERRKIQIKEGINEYLFDYKNDGKVEVFYYTFEVGDKVMTTNRMIKRR